MKLPWWSYISIRLATVTVWFYDFNSLVRDFIQQHITRFTPSRTSHFKLRHIWFTRTITAGSLCRSIPLARVHWSGRILSNDKISRPWCALLGDQKYMRNAELVGHSSDLKIPSTAEEPSILAAGWVRGITRMTSRWLHTTDCPSQGTSSTQFESQVPPSTLTLSNACRPSQRPGDENLLFVIQYYQVLHAVRTVKLEFCHTTLGGGYDRRACLKRKQNTCTKKKETCSIISMPDPVKLKAGISRAGRRLPNKQTHTRPLMSEDTLRRSDSFHDEAEWYDSKHIGTVRSRSHYRRHCGKHTNTVTLFCTIQKVV